MAMATQASLAAPELRRAGFSGRHDLDRELGSAVLDACRSLWREFVELSSVNPSAFPVDEQDLLRWYAEWQFRLGAGGGRCGECRTHVRHALPMRCELRDGSERRFLCLCTRCMVALEHSCDRMWYDLGDRVIEHPLRRNQLRAARF